VLGDPPWDVEDELAEIRCPTLIMCGRHDTQCPLPWSELMHDRIPDSELAVFEGSGHFPFEEEPDGFRAGVGEFLASLGARSTEAEATRA